MLGRKEKHLLIGFYNYSVALTYTGLACSVIGITQAIEKRHAMCFICLIISGICDLFDGKIARSIKNRTEREKVFGIQIDSLSDLVCFGVFPAILGYSFGFNHGLGILSSYLIVQCAVIRLGTFNVMEEERQRSSINNRTEYRGLPVTSVAIVLPIIYLSKHFVGNLLPYIFQGFELLISIFFILNIKVKKLNLKGFLILFTIAILILIGFLRGRLK